MRLRADAGYFAGELAGVTYFGCPVRDRRRRIAPLWRLLAGISEDDYWSEATNMIGAQADQPGSSGADLAPHPSRRVFSPEYKLAIIAEYPELVAHGPSEVWSWDITAMKGPVKGVWHKCHVAFPSPHLER